MAARGRYDLTQVPSPLVQPGGHFRFPRGKTVVIGEESDAVTPKPADGGASDGAQNAFDPQVQEVVQQVQRRITPGAAPQVQDPPAPGASTQVAPRPVTGAEQAKDRRHTHRGCAVFVTVVMVIVVLGAAEACSAFMDAVYDVADDFDAMVSDSGSRVSYEADYDSGYDDGSLGAFSGSGAHDEAQKADDAVYDALASIESGLITSAR